MGMAYNLISMYTAHLNPVLMDVLPSHEAGGMYSHIKPSILPVL